MQRKVYISLFLIEEKTVESPMSFVTIQGQVLSCCNLLKCDMSRHLTNPTEISQCILSEKSFNIRILSISLMKPNYNIYTLGKK